MQINPPPDHRSHCNLFRQVFVSQKRVSGFPEKGADVRRSLGKSRELPGKSAELSGKAAKFPGNLWIAVKFHSERTCGEVAGKLPGKVRELGNFRGVRGLSRSSGEHDSIPATRQICLQAVWRARSPLPDHISGSPRRFGQGKDAPIRIQLRAGQVLPKGSETRRLLQNPNHHCPKCKFQRKTKGATTKGQNRLGAFTLFGTFPHIFTPLQSFQNFSFRTFS